MSLDSVGITIYGMPCTNSCAHCWAQGSPEELYYLSNLAGQKWVALYLAEVVPSLGFS